MEERSLLAPDPADDGQVVESVRPEVSDAEATKLLGTDQAAVLQQLFQEEELAVESARSVGARLGNKSAGTY